MCSLLREIVEQCDLGGRQLSKRADRQITEPDRAKANALQTHDLVIHTSQQPANLTVLAFVQHDVQVRAVSDRLLHPHPFDGEPAFLEVHTALQLGECFR